MLDKQIHIYSCDTADFYSNEEKRLHTLNHKLRREKNMYLNGWVTYKFDEDSGEHVLDDKGKPIEIKHDGLKDLEKRLEDAEDDERDNLEESINELRKKIADKSAKAKKIKDRLLSLLSNKVEENIRTNGRHHIRELREDQLSENNVISVFDSYFTRTIGAQPDEFCDDFMVVQVYYFDVVKDLIYHGFMYKGEKYVYFTSSAGQIRTKKCVFVKESTWLKHQKTIMCGLTVDDINAKGGNNPNKHLAYLALANSATDVWEEFDIDKTIVVNDFETEVDGEYEFINDVDYSIEPMSGHAAIEHTDGAGMMLPCMGKNRMVRLPWIKGLLGVFDFRRFIEVNGCSSIVEDIYGKKHDVIAEDIQIIFTKSQFKMWKYYDSWDDYKEKYKKYNCSAGMTNIEEDKIKDATINYQMLQSLTDVKDEQIEGIARVSVNRLNNLYAPVKIDDEEQSEGEKQARIRNIKNVFGITPNNTQQTAFQKAIDLYPNLLNDKYAKEHLKAIKDSMVKKYKSGKLNVHGKYTFVLPDFYAACEHWFMGVDNPNGLLEDGEVFCSLFKKNAKLDCLRSPHLYKEHPIRMNLACDSYDAESARREKAGEWFCTKAIYTSCKDLISRVLQFDVDGDKLLVVADKKLIEVAETNMKGVKPLYYNMRKAESAPITNETIYNGLNAAFSGANIGDYSNNISKIWNSDIFVSGTPDEKREATDIVKLLCMENNYVIDFAKTLYKPERPDDENEKITAFTNKKLPHFFKYAKDKNDNQVVECNGSLVNKLDSIIPNPKINLYNFGLGRIDYRLMMSDANNECRARLSDKGKIIKEETDPLIVRYCDFDREYYFSVDAAIAYDDEQNSTDKFMKKVLKYRQMVNRIKSELSQFGYDDDKIADILVSFLYNPKYGKNRKNKTAFWMCYGDKIVENLKRNIRQKNEQEKIEAPKIKVIQCVDCGEWFEVDIFNSATCRCDECYREHRREEDRIRKQEQSEFGKTKTIVCCDCNKEFEVGVKDTKTERCDNCYAIYRKQKKSETQKARRLKNKMKSDQIPQTL